MFSRSDRHQVLSKTTSSLSFLLVCWAVTEGTLFSRPAQNTRVCTPRTKFGAEERLLAVKNTFLAGTFCFPNSDYVMFSREFAFCPFIIYA